MRRFSEKEKKTIRLIVVHADNNRYPLINTFEDIFFNSKKVGYNHANHELTFYWKTPPSNATDEILDLEKEIYGHALLIQYLLDNRFLYLIEDECCNKLESLGEIPKVKQVQKSKKIDEQISNIIYECANHRFFVSQELIDLYENDFLTYEDKTLLEAKRQTNLAVCTLCIAVITLLLSIVA